MFDLLPLAGLFDDGVFAGGAVDGFGQVAVTGDALHLGVVRKLLLQLLVVVECLPLTGV